MKASPLTALALICLAMPVFAADAEHMMDNKMQPCPDGKGMSHMEDGAHMMKRDERMHDANMNDCMMDMPMMRKHMAEMHEQMEAIADEQDPEKRQVMMETHMDDMQRHMDMMQRMMDHHGDMKKAGKSQ